MYGIVNKAFKDLIIERFGEPAWVQIKIKSDVKTDVFLSNQPYDDEITFKMAGAAVEVLEIPLSEVLVSLGEHWILRTGMEKYGSLMEAGGDNVRDFLINLPNFHSRIMLMFPELRPPEFRISNEEENSLWLHYYSDRKGLEEFVRGLLQGLGTMFDSELEIQHIESRQNGFDHEIFKVSW